MKPKDLLEHLEKGDRTMQHLTKKPESFMNAGSELIDRLSRFYSGSWQLGNQQGLGALNAQGWTQGQMSAGTLYTTNTGGIQRW